MTIRLGRGGGRGRFGRHSGDTGNSGDLGNSRLDRTSRGTREFMLDRPVGAEKKEGIHLKIIQ